MDDFEAEQKMVEAAFASGYAFAKSLNLNADTVALDAAAWEQAQVRYGVQGRERWEFMRGFSTAQSDYALGALQN